MFEACVVGVGEDVEAVSILTKFLQPLELHRVDEAHDESREAHFAMNPLNQNSILLSEIISLRLREVTHESLNIFSVGFFTSLPNGPSIATAFTHPGPLENSLLVHRMIILRNATLPKYT